LFMRNAALPALLLVTTSVPGWPAKLPFTFDAMTRLARIDDPQVSPDDKWVAFTVRTVDLPNNTVPSQIYVIPVAGGIAQRITNEGASNSRPRWTPDSKRIFYISNRPNASQIAGNSQVWSINPDGTDARPITNVPTGADGITISPDGNLVMYTSDVYPACEPSNASSGVDYHAACNKSNLDKDAANKVKARVYTSLLYRHWNEYGGVRRRHLLIQTLNNTGKIRDLTPGDRETPPFSLGGPDGYVFSPDSTQIAFVANSDADLSSSTNSDIFAVPASGGMIRHITTNPGADEGPLYSPDGKYLAYRTQSRSGYESDQWRLAVWELREGRTTTLTDSLDRWVESFTWSADSQRIFFTIDDRGRSPLLMISAAGGAPRTIAQGETSISAMHFTSGDQMMVYLEESGTHPPEIYRASSRGGSGVPLTHLNDSVTNMYQLTPLERISVDGADGSKVESFVVKPPDFNPSIRYPVLLLLHGGPQGEWGESWTYRWNAQVFAGAGYVVVLPNPHGSVGYGQAFTDAINGDWGGRVYTDIMATADYMSNLPYVDGERMVAAGGSYGGYLVDWILGHTNRFKALVSHAGPFDLRSEAETTEELWFPKWEFRGLPWDNPGLYERWSPSAYVKNFKTPTLVTQGELDYRVPLGQSQQLFTALQQMKVPSKLVLFPDEGHWILKPQNSQFWYTTVIEWLNRYARPTTSAGGVTAH
jgi:dipeptidyl aminopeptidase/acylaminoacyl peptidase